MPDTGQSLMSETQQMLSPRQAIFHQHEQKLVIHCYFEAEVRKPLILQAFPAFLIKNQRKSCVLPAFPAFLNDFQSMGDLPPKSQMSSKSIKAGKTLLLLILRTSDSWGGQVPHRLKIVQKAGKAGNT